MPVVGGEKAAGFACWTLAQVAQDLARATRHPSPGSDGSWLDRCSFASRTRKMSNATKWSLPVPGALGPARWLCWINGAKDEEAGYEPPTKP